MRVGGSLRGYACSLPSKGDADDLEEFNFVREERERVKNAAKAAADVAKDARLEELTREGDADDLEEFNFVREERERVKNAAKAVCFLLLILRTRKRLLRSKSGSEEYFMGRGSRDFRSRCCRSDRSVQ